MPKIVCALRHEEKSREAWTRESRAVENSTLTNERQASSFILSILIAVANGENEMMCSALVCPLASARASAY